MSLFYSFFKSLDKKGTVEVIVELKNEMAIRGTLLSVDQHLNIRLGNVHVDTKRYPQMAAVKVCFIRGSVIRYIQLPPVEVDSDLLIQATKRELAKESKS
nr:LSm2 [Diplonema papillatum]